MEFILEIPNQLPSDLCKDLIKRFEVDPDKYPGKVAAGRNDPRVKRSVDLTLSDNKRFKDLDTKLYARLKEGLLLYQRHLGTKLNHVSNYESLIGQILHDTCDTGYQMQRIKKGDFYIWHNDYSPHSDRLIAYIWYLNKLDGGKGGTTDFYCNKSIQPEEGKLLLFPATWTYIHNGVKNETDDDKYIIAGFVVKRDNNKEMKS